MATAEKTSVVSDLAQMPDSLGIPSKPMALCSVLLYSMRIPVEDAVIIVSYTLLLMAARHGHSITAELIPTSMTSDLLTIVSALYVVMALSILLLNGKKST